MDRWPKIILIAIIFIILIILMFDIYVAKFGKFWQVGKGKELQQGITTTTKFPDQTATKEKLNNFLPQIFNPSYLPSKSSVTLVEDRTTPDSFKINWESKEATIGGVLVVSPSYDFTSIFLSLGLLKNQILNPNQAKTLLSQIFSLNPSKDFKCKAIKTGAHCESFWEENLVKKGLGIQGPIKLSNNQTGLIVSFCQLSPTSQQYKWQSCTAEFAKMGIK